MALLCSSVASFLFIKKFNISLGIKNSLEITNGSFWRYGFFGGLSSVVTQLLIIIDILLIGYLIDDPVAVTNYRYVSIIPFSLLFLPRVFITTDFVSFTEKIRDTRYINNYIKNYMIFFTLISFILLFSYIFGKDFVFLAKNMHYFQRVFLF